MGKSEFFAEMDAKYMRNPLMNLEHIVGMAVVQVQSSRESDCIELAFIKSLDAGQGHASKALDAVTKMASRHGLSVCLYVFPCKEHAVARSAALGKMELRAWYIRHGFISDAKSGYLIHKPQGEKHGRSTGINNESRADR